MADAEEKKKAKASKKAAKAEKKKGEPQEGDEEEESTGGKVLVAFVAILIVIIWLAILALLIKTDVGGFGSTVLYPILKDVPVVNKILPDVASEDGSEDDAYSYASVDDAVERIKELEAQVAELEASGGTDAATIADLEAQSEELAQYKQDEAEFEAEKEKFYEEVVFSDNAPDIDEYKQYYESIDPDNAAVLYKQVVSQEQEDEDLENYVKAYSSMKPAQAAAIFDTMTDNLKLVGKILWAMEAEDRGDILGAMDTDTAAKVTKLMEP